MRTLEIGDVITTAEELDTLPSGSALFAGGHIWVFTKVAAGDIGYRNALDSPSYAGAWTYTADFLAHHKSATIIYLPGILPRPERVVKAETLQEAAKEGGPITNRISVATWLRNRAERIEKGEQK